MEKYKTITSQTGDQIFKLSEINKFSDKTSLHEDILDILFKHKEEIYRKLIDLRGIFLLDHIAIKVIDPNGKIMIFSITPSVEYNLIVQDLWKHDESFSIDFNNRYSFYSWEKAYSEQHFQEIKKIKELKHGFNFGFNISKNLNGFKLIYCFATRSKNPGLSEYYQAHENELIKLGDYGYKLIQDLYFKYSDPQFGIPNIVNHDDTFKKKKPFLKLITNK